ncbi:MAG: DUF262 domain-containing protein [Caulobacteraceae bacterium]|nr:DUF262 domain-containing protein [Caulobacteraceae bacterium]
MPIRKRLKPDNEGFTEEAQQIAEREIVERSKRIDFYLVEYTIEFLANKMHDGEFVVPPYQREFTWEEHRRSRFIESILMGLPIPFLFFWEMEDGRLEVVDGSQRLRTIEEWVHKDFELGELDELPSLSHSKFSDLLESRQRKIKNRSIRGIVLNEHADEQARFDMFERINTGSKAANKAEVRRGALGGPFIDLVIELAETSMFKKLAPVPEKALNEREREELVTRFFAYSDGLDGYKDRPAQFLFDYAKRMNDTFANSPQLVAVYRDRFLKMIAFIAANTPHGFRKTSTSKTTPRVRFEALSIGSYLAMRDQPALFKDGPNTPVKDWLDSPEFSKVTTSDGANVQSKLRGRINFVHERLLA